ncbi:MAG: hypothetical protein WCO23_02465 [bacterium]
MNEEIDTQSRQTTNPNNQQVNLVHFADQASLPQAAVAQQPISQPVQQPVQPQPYPVAPPNYNNVAPNSLATEPPNFFSPAQNESQPMVDDGSKVNPNKALIFFQSLDLPKVIIAIFIIVLLGGGVYYLSKSQNNNSIANVNNSVNTNQGLANENVNDDTTTGSSLTDNLNSSNSSTSAYPTSVGTTGSNIDFPIPETSSTIASVDNSNLNSNSGSSNSNSSRIWKILDQSLGLTLDSPAVRIGANTTTIYPVSLSFVGRSGDDYLLNISNTKNVSCNIVNFSLSSTKEYACGQYHYLLEYLSLDLSGNSLTLRVSQSQ